MKNDKNLEMLLYGLECAFNAAKNIDGLSHVEWNFHWIGTNGKPEEIAAKVNQLMKECGCTKIS